MGKLRDWLRGDGDRPRWSRLQYAVAACGEDLQDELQDEWNDWTPDKFTGDDSFTYTFRASENQLLSTAPQAPVDRSR